MPPFIPFRRPNSATPSPPPPTRTPAKRTRKRASTKTSKAGVFEAADARPKAKYTAADNRKFLDGLEDEDSSSLSEVSTSTDDTPVKSPSPKRRRIDQKPRSGKEGEVKKDPQTTISSKATANDDGSSSESDSSSSSGSSSSNDDDDHWDTYLAAQARGPSLVQTTASDTQNAPTADEGGDIELHLDEGATIDLTAFSSRNNGKKKGPTKIERQIRYGAHQIHVQTLMYHNWLRNKWCNDRVLHKILSDGLTQNVKAEVKRWKEVCGEQLSQEEVVQAEKDRKARGKTASSKKHKNQRDWSAKAQEQRAGSVSLSHGDPTLRLLKYLSAYWRKRFNVTCPGLRKQGYKDLRRLKDEVDALQHGPRDSELHGERMERIKDFQNAAKTANGSRDVGAQLFTALLRAVGVEARLVASLQPIGFGWSKVEEAHPAKPPSKKKTALPAKSTVSKSAANGRSTTQQPSGKAKEDAIVLSDSDSELTPPPSDTEMIDFEYNDGDDASIVDMTPSKSSMPPKRFDRDLAYPIYWTEVLSPVTNRWIPVDPIVLSVVASSEESHSVFEPRGSKAEKAKQVLAYVVAFSGDNTAKDVTVRYLKGHLWPGKTKGYRIPTEKIAVTNKRGKTIRTYDYDWFGTVMSSYINPRQKSTKADKLEDEGDLVPVRRTKGSTSNSEEPDSLQAYKASAEYVLERHLRREEAIQNSARPVRNFVVGKGDNAKAEPVFLRKDVVSCKTVESWHKEGREVKAGEQPLKWVPMRAVTLNRKMEMEAMERETGEKPQQGLYSRQQTDWIIPPPIENGVIPKNAYGNIDIYVDTMIPKGAVHVPLKGTARICRKLGVDHAEACTGFEFGNKMAVPILTGVVVAAENKKLVVDAWRAEELVKKEREAKKIQQMVFALWKKMYNGLKVIERVRQEYGDGADSELRIREEVQQSMTPKGKKTTAASARNRNKIQHDFPRSKPFDNEEDLMDQAAGGSFTLGEDTISAIAFDDTRRHHGMQVNVTEHDPEADGGGFIIEDETMPSHRSIASVAGGTAPISMRALAKASPATTSSIAIEEIRERSSEVAPTEESAGPSRPYKKKAASQQSPKTTRAATGKSREAARPRSTMTREAKPKAPVILDNSDSRKSDTVPKPISDTGRSTRTSGRRSARNSAAKTRSHYFEADAMDEDDELQ